MSRRKHSGEQQMERRHFPRYKVTEGTVAFVDATPHTIIDISEVGMAVNYVPISSDEVIAACFDLFCVNDKSYLPNIPGAVVAEQATFPAPLFSNLRTKRVSIRFTDLSKQQLKSLRLFIDQVASGSA